MNSSKNWELKVDERIDKELGKIPQKYAQRVAAIIEALPLDPFTGDIEKIKGEKSIWRRRIGNYRIFYELNSDDKIIHVFWVERRTSKTY